MRITVTMECVRSGGLRDRVGTISRKQRTTSKENTSRPIKGKYKNADANTLLCKVQATQRHGGFSVFEYEEIYKFENIYKAYRKARLGKKWKEAAAKFEVNLLEALHLLSSQLKNKTYSMAAYNVFKVYEPKERLIMSNSYKDKVVQHALCDNVLTPILTKSFIYDNYASQEGKGTLFGLNRLRDFMRSYYNKYGNNGYILKCDISKYFYNIRHDILKAQIRKQVADANTLWLVDLIIDSTEGIGIPIGNQTSQLFALLYLNSLDHFIKEKLHIKYYGRYMDDFYLIHPDKQYLKHCLNEITKIVDSLGLKLNNKTQIFPLANGIDFLGFHSYLTETGKVIRKVRAKSKNNARRKLKKMRKLVDNGSLPLDRVQASYNSWRGHAKNGNSHHLLQRMDNYYNSLFKEEQQKCHKQ